MRYYLDCEFDEECMQPISVALVREDGTEFYWVNSEYGWLTAPRWLVENVKPVLEFGGPAVQDVPWARRALVEFLQNDPDPQFYGWCSAWDIVMVHSMFGGWTSALEYGAHVPLTCFDLHQVVAVAGRDKLEVKKRVPPLKPEHNALVDARWNKQVHEYLQAALPGWVW